VRTDPNAEEVRAIVARVFAGFLPKRGAGVSPAWNSHGSRDGCTGRFPRLFEPEIAGNEQLGRGPIAEIAETIVIDRGRPVARSYRTEGYLAMWLLAVGIVQFYDDRGRMLATVNLFESLRPQRLAA
jgi:hypothetical protein